MRRRTCSGSGRHADQRRHVGPPSPWEVGRKDSALAPGSQITRIQATFDHVSRYVWHCHFLDHEDDAMMCRWQCLPY